MHQMIGLAIGAVLFLITHLVPGIPAVRRYMIASLGEGAYRALFSLVALFSLGILIWGYGQAPYVPLWDGSGALRHLAFTLMLFAVAFAVLGLTQRNPTMAGADAAGAPAPKAVGVLKITRHPLMWGIMIWAVAHVLANGDLATTILGVTIFIVAFAGSRLIEIRKRRDMPVSWMLFAAASSYIPFAAVFAGKAKGAFAEIAWWRWLVALVVYGALFAGHRWIAGVPLM
ncbi:NnrU family protein [Tistrella mobilis]|uniref:NnrU family protein n=1 Tax=Tistrella mobilis TaxID=171437 RepID=UPI0031F6C70E